jgi:hypothetical protein
MSVSPRMLDWALNGVPVYIRRRPIDGVAYATTYDFSQFIKEPPLHTMRVRINKDTPAGWDPTTHKSVVKKVAEFNR